MKKYIFYLFILLLSTLNCYAQAPTVKGTVVDERGDPMPGVTITLKNTQVRTATSLNGTFTINVSSDAAKILVFTFIGYKPKEVHVAGKTTIDVKMEPVAASLTEVVVTALNISRTTASLGVSQQTVNVDQMTEARAANITDLLDGKIAGLQVTTSGQTNGSTRLVIRGPGSITGDNQPLWVVDGVPIDNTDSNGQAGNFDFGNNAADLNADDIASITVLKGPNAAALYGSRAANGAIIVTTKKGRPNAGLGISVNENYMQSRILQFPAFQNVYGEGGNFSFNGSRDLTTNLLIAGSNVRASWGSPMLGQPLETAAGIPSTYSPHPDNVTSLYSPAYAINQNFAISNATDNSSIRFSYTRTDANDVLQNQNVQAKNNFQLNTSKTFSPIIKIDTRIQYLQSDVKNRTARNEDANNPNNIYNNLLRDIDPETLLPYKDASGNEYNLGNSSLENYYWLVNENHNEDNTNTIIGGITATIGLFKGLDFRAQTAGNLIWGTRNNFIQKGAATNKNGSYSEFQQNNQTWNTEGLFLYNKNFKNYSILANLGGNIRTQNYYNTSAGTNFLVVHDVASLSNNASVVSTNESLTKSQTNSLYGTLSVGYKSFLYVDVTGRNDWSSTLPAANRSFFYPSISTSFVFTELFSLPKNIFTFGKLRGSIAVVGNDTSPYNLVGAFTTSSLPFNGSPLVQYDPVLRNANLKPEKTKSTEFGLELRLLKDRLGLEATVYDKSTSNQILQGSIPSSSGFSSQYINAGEVDNKGLEITLNGTPVVTKNFRWNAVANFSVNRNKVVSLSQGLQSFQIGNNVLLTGLYADVGQPIGNIKGEDVYKDAHGNPIILPTTFLPYSASLPFTSSPSVNVSVGNYQPKALGSFGSDFHYKNFDFSFLVTARLGGQIFSGSYWRSQQNGVTLQTLGGRDAYELSNIIFGEGSTALNGTTSIYQHAYPDAGRQKGLIFPGYYPLLDANGNIVYDANGLMIAGKPNTQYISPQIYWGRVAHIMSMVTFDDSYIRLSQVILGYTVPTKLLSRTAFKSARFALVARNPWLILQRTPRGVDPESANSSGNTQGFELGGALPITSYGFDFKFSL